MPTENRQIMELYAATLITKSGVVNQSINNVLTSGKSNPSTDIMHEWLKNYAYRIPLSASIFLLAIGSSILIAWLTVAHRAINAALANPIKSLRTE